MKLKGVLVICVLLAAASTYAALGSIVSSFHIGKPINTTGVFRDASNVYVISYLASKPYGFMRVYDTSGVFVRSATFASVQHPGDSDRCHLGDGYIAVPDYATGYLHFVNKSTGSTVSSFYATYPGGGTGYVSAWNGTYYFLSGYSGRGTFNLYTTAGSLVDSWAAAGWPYGSSAVSSLGAASRVNGLAGTYLVVTSASGMYDGCAALAFPSGALVQTWQRERSGQGGVCGPGYPSTLGETYWVSLRTYGEPTDWTFQYDLGNGSMGVTGSNIAPASVGKIKALYR